MSISSLDGIRRRALAAFLVLLWLQIPLIIWACRSNGRPMVQPVGGAFAFVLLVQLLARLDRRGDHARMVAAAAIMALISILVGVMSGNKVQVDLHMYYFAGLAVMVAACDWRVIAVGATTVVLHHLVLNFLLPALIYPEGGDLARFLLHAAIVIAEASVLIWTASMIKQTLEAIVTEQQRVEAARGEADANQVRAARSAKDARHAQDLTAHERARTASDDAETLRSLGAALGQLAAGDLTHRVAGGLPAKAERLRHDFNEAVDSLADALGSVSTSTGSIRSTSREVATAAEDLASRTERQAAWLERTALTLGTVTATGRQASHGATKARAMVNTAKTDAEQSGQVVSRAVQAMTAIEASSRQIGQIIGVIDEIAFQTSLLALNAGVEAARAGDSGRGFAVVASEVRGLAQRSAEAAKEIKTLITSSSTRVDEGVALVSRTGQVLERIVVQVADINTAMVDIAASTHAQAIGLDEVNTAIRQLTEMTQQNAAMVDETTAASQTLAREADHLAHLLTRFDLTDGQTRPRAEALPLRRVA